MRAGLVVVSLVLASCTPGSAPGSDADVDAGHIGELGTTPVGGGVCCLIETLRCDGGYRGGWAPSMSMCHDIAHGAAQDVGTFDTLVDEHGCPYATPHYGGSCECLCFDSGPPPPDLGWDSGPPDLGVDAYHPGF